jgi:hypothetical protein
VNPETDTPSSLTAFFIGKSALNNSLVTFAKPVPAMAGQLPDTAQDCERLP